jgi:hypothetical protein
MASIPIQIDGVLWDHAAKAGTKVSLLGQASIVGLTVGGGPIVPPDVTPPPVDGAHPEHPIVLPPDGAHPEHPIVLPPIDVPPEPPEGPPDAQGFIKPPATDGTAMWAYHETYGWLFEPGETAPGPKA